MSERVEIKWDDRAAKDKIQRVVEEALWLAGQNAITLAMPNVPLDTGTLRRSGTVTMDRLPDKQLAYEYAVDGRGNRGTSTKRGVEAPRSARRWKDIVVYVSYNTPYAIWLHESPNWRPRAWKWTSWKSRKGKEAFYRIERRNEQGKKEFREKIPKPAVGTWKWLEKALPTVKRRWSGYVSRAKRKVGL